ncbi:MULTISPECIES: DUF1294 domain-containing protein [unclassified Uliginosibacterium]|uniref:DUF1294 domain-containing protein n=1 Tax=unclassified Uliginosibacterium TaxID=2621521 RepID=UPI000C7E6012|nr:MULTISPECIES: DUF1294 domain-containing protein [unclassified Uliginosibacterium]MDO6386134.1 DUF1294 domain-containing protein [Uliginosibacterium sp. 31-12]PLK49202.1 DUF1294 domain-containing protein [Uliginosibacterium sp. TH139]
MRFVGKLTTWKDDQGFGFITPNGGGERVFLHVKALPREASRPSEGELFTYELELDERKRPRAKTVARVGEKVVKVPDGRGAKAPLFAMTFCLFLLGAVTTGYLPFTVVLVYAAASLITFVAYWLDKGAAQAGRWRTAESTLHLFALAGGWPGALAAQRVLRHKSIKQEFQFVFWMTVLLNCGAVAYLLSESGQFWLKNIIA